jgi:bacteriorhodopsin
MRSLVLLGLFAAVAANGKAAKAVAKEEVVEVTLSEQGKKIVWAGFVGVAVPAAYFAYVTNGIPDGAKKYHIYTTFICAIATLAYLTMATGHGVFIRPFDGREFFYARYIDWTLTTPLMLLDLLGFAGAGADTTWLLVGCDVIMVVSGLIAAFLEGQEKWYFWGFGVLVFLPILYYLNELKGSETCKANEQISNLYNSISNLTMLTWTCYPIVWVLAEGRGQISADTEALCYTVLDVLAKSVFGFLIMRARVHESNNANPTNTSSSAPGANDTKTPAPAADGGSML